MFRSLLMSWFSRQWLGKAALGRVVLGRTSEYFREEMEGIVCYVCSRFTYYYCGNSCVPAIVHCVSLLDEQVLCMFL